MILLKKLKYLRHLKTVCFIDIVEIFNLSILLRNLYLPECKDIQIVR